MRQRARERIGAKFLGEDWKERVKELEPTMADRVRAAQQSNWLTPDEVREIRKRVEAGEDCATIAADLGRSESSVTRVARGETYTHVPDEPELVCPECDREFTTRGGLGSHTDRVHGFYLTSCGSMSGYKRHQRNDETPCDPCREANAAYKRRRRK